MRVVPNLISMSGGGVIVGLNAALQKRFVLPSSTPSLIPGSVHRIQDVQVGVGGKGQDVSIALACLGYEKQKIAQFLGTGAEGDQVYELLEEKVGTDAMSLTVRTQSKLRTCTSVVATDTTTELIEPSGIITQDEMEQLLNKLDQLDAASAVCVMGSMPPGCDPNTYAEIYQRSSNPDTVCVIDSVAGLEPLLEKTKQGKTIFKVNASELCTLAGVTKSNNEVDGIESKELIAAIQGFLAKYPPTSVTAIAITDGKHPAHFVVLQEQDKDSKFLLYQLPIHPLPKDKTLFPIGAGDAVAAGTLAAWQCLLEQQQEESTSCLPTSTREALTTYQSALEEMEEVAMLTAFSFGLACGSASCLQEENSVLDTDDVIDILQKGKPAFLSSHAYHYETTTIGTTSS